MYSRSSLTLVVLALVVALAAVAGGGCSSNGGDIAPTATTLATFIYEPQPPPPAGLLAEPDSPFYTEDAGFSPDAARMLTALSFQFSLEQYRVARNRYPTALAELIPDFAPVGEDGNRMTSVDGDGWAKDLRYEPVASGDAYSLSIPLASGQAYRLTSAGP